jgi:DNA-binding response OmpR family regulator
MPSRILVIEDEPSNIQTLSTLLKERGYNINIATNGRQGLEVLERIRPDLILLDIMMPEIDGFETCRRIKASTAWREIPIIFLTAKTDTADIVRGFELGAVDYVAKPFNAHELLARVNTHLTLDHLHRENERLPQRAAGFHRQQTQTAGRGHRGTVRRRLGSLRRHCRIYAPVGAAFAHRID